MSFLDRIAACNRHDLTAYRPLELAGQRIGWVRHEMADGLRAWPTAFDVGDDGVALMPDDASPGERSRLLAELLPEIVEAGLVPKLRGEDYAVRNRWSDPTLFSIDRAAAIPFGVRSYGVHLNGYVRRPDGLHMWVGRRARDKAVAPV